MCLSFALVKNLRSDATELIFSRFKLKKIQRGDSDALKSAQGLFPGGFVHYGDWIYERHYNGSMDDLLDRVPFDTEDVLLLLRLFRVGDLVFLQPCIQEPDGSLLRQLPYRVMSYITTIHKFHFGVEDCLEFDEFAADMTSHENWSSTWFQTTRRFFLYGSSKEFNPGQHLFDRVVDYTISLESALVPETDFVSRRLRERAASLLSGVDVGCNNIKRLLTSFYNVRSTVVHGGDPASLTNAVQENSDIFERISRMAIVEALKRIPYENAHREAFLKQLFDVRDQTRAEKVYSDFCAIKNDNEKKLCLARLSKRVQ